MVLFFFFFFSSRRRHTRSLRDWSSDVCSSDLLGLADELDLVVTRDDMRALKPDPDGWRVIAEHFGAVARGSGDPSDAVVVGDSWVDGVAAAKAGVSFIAYRARQEYLDRWQVTPIVHLADLALLPAWLTLRRNGRR